jgi:O-antigen/teichoic acid export membrane protein
VGVEGYGLWILYTSIPAFLALSDFGISEVAATEATGLNAKGLTAEARSLLSGVWAFVLAVMLGVLGIIGIAMLVANLVVHRSIFWFPNSLTIIWLTATYIMLSILCKVCEGTTRAAGRFPTGLLWLAGMNLLDLALLTLFLLVHPTLLSAALALVASRALMLPAFHIYLRRVIPELAPRLAGAQMRQGANLLRKGFALLSLPIGNMMVLQGTNIGLGIVLGPVALVQLSIVRTVASIISQVCGIPSIAAIPQFTVLLSTGEQLRARILLRNLLRVNLSTTIVIGTVLIFAGTPLIRWWTDGKISVPLLILIAYVVTVAADTPWRTYLIALWATNQHSRIAWRYLLSCTFGVITGIAFAPVLGIISVPIALLIIDIALTKSVYVHAMAITGLAPSQWTRG